MKLELSKIYKSLNPFTFDLPDFTIITGLNGAGKTHLLQAVSTYDLKLTEDNVKLEPNMYITTRTLSPLEGTKSKEDNFKKNCESLWSRYHTYLIRKKSNPNLKKEHEFPEVSRIKALEEIAREAGKDFDSLSLYDIFDFYPIDDGLNNNEIFYQNFLHVFKRYWDKLNNNLYREFINARYNENHKYYSKEEFYLKFGEPPWEFMNKILDEAKLGYRASFPTSLIRDIPFELKLISNSTGIEIDFKELSSGEKVLMSLALAIYNSNHNVLFPKVLLMDEPDASLHPSMTKQFLDVLQKVFVEEKKVKVIITTHSPSTVALAPDDALYIMTIAEPRIKKVSKDKALKVLLDGVPSLSVNYENRKQVFVESSNDAYFYEKFYSKLTNLLEQEISLNFISSGNKGSGSSDNVKNVVNQLTKFGNKSIYGIVDWDKKNIGTKFVKVLGENKRYSIENYIFDPLLVSALLIREKISTRTGLGLEENENYTDFKNFSNEKLQKIADNFFEKIKVEFGSQSNTDKIKINYVSGKEIEVFDWYLKYHGHELEDKLKIIFQEFQKYQKKNEFKEEVLTKIVDDIPELIPRDILDLFKSIQHQ